MSNDERQPETRGRYTAKINPPQPIDFSQNRKDNFERFHKQWQNYSIMSRLNDEREEYQVALMKYTVGEQCVKIIENADTEHSTIDSIFTVLKKHCVGDANIVFRRFVNSSCQKEDFDMYFVVRCNFGNLQDAFIREKEAACESQSNLGNYHSIMQK